MNDLLPQILTELAEPIMVVILAAFAILIRTLGGQYITAQQQRSLHSAIITGLGPILLRRAGAQITETELINAKKSAQAHVFGPGAAEAARKLGATSAAVDLLAERKLSEAGIRVIPDTPAGVSR